MPSFSADRHQPQEPRSRGRLERQARCDLGRRTPRRYVSSATGPVQGSRRRQECRKFCPFFDDRSPAERWVVLGCAFTIGIAGRTRMSSPTQVAAVAIWAALSAFSFSCNLALAGPVARSTNAAATTAPVAPPAAAQPQAVVARSEEHTSELQSRGHLVCRLLLEKKKKRRITQNPPRT